MKRICVLFLDRDGVINRRAPLHQYVTKWEQFYYLPGVYESFNLFSKAGYKVVIVSNQRCIARGIASLTEIEKLNKILLKDISNHGGSLEAIYYCPHDIKDNCSCRKPKPGMLLQAEIDFRNHGMEVYKDKSWMIGDSSSDIQAGINYGVNTIRILSNDENASDRLQIPDNLMYFEASSLLDASKIILEKYT